MTNILEILNFYGMMVNTPRQCGKTTALKEAAEKINADLLLRDRRQAKYHNGISFSNLYKLQGRKNPMLFDNDTLRIIFRQAASKIEELQKKIDSIKKTLNE